jgi:hypothetical protein
VLVYATTADLVADPWNVSPMPANVDRLLVRASQMVRGATKTALYDTDDAGMPTGPDVLAGFRDATCAQVSAWVTAGIVDPSTASATSSSGVVASKTLGPRSISYAGADAVAAERARIAGQLTDEALAILDDLDLWHGVLVIG